MKRFAHPIECVAAAFITIIILLTGIFVVEKIFPSTTEEVVALTVEPIQMIPEVEVIECNEEILPDGIYLYSVDGAYMTVGIMTTGRVSGTDRKAGHITFYGTTDFGEIISTYETVFIENEKNSCLFECVGNKYSIEYLEYGSIKVNQLVVYDELGTDIGFEGEYIFLYSFEDSTVEGS